MAVFFGAFAVSRSFPIALLLVGLASVQAGPAFGTLQSTLTLILAPADMRGALCRLSAIRYRYIYLWRTGYRSGG